VLADPAGDDIFGINTHHRVTDGEGWKCIELLNRLVSEHPAAEWARPDRLFTEPR
jgi:hypothetical protein